MAAARSLIQPIAPGLGRLDPVTLRVGDEHDFDDLLVRLVELAYTRVEMVTARGEFAVRGGIVDVFPPTAEHPSASSSGATRSASCAASPSRTSGRCGPVDVLHAPGCRELLLTAEVRDRAAALARAHENNPALRELLERLAEGIPAEGMESLIPALVGGAELELLTDLLPAGAPVLLADPERIRTRAGTSSAPARSSSRRAGSPPVSAATRRSTSAPVPTAAWTRCSSTPRRPAARSSRSAR